MPEGVAEFQETPNRYTVTPESERAGVYRGVSANEIRDLFRREAEVDSADYQAVVKGLRVAFERANCGVDTYDGEGKVRSEAGLSEDGVREIAAVIIEDRIHDETGGRAGDSPALEHAKEFLRPFRTLSLAAKKIGEKGLVKVSEEVAVAREIEARMKDGQGEISDGEAGSFIGACQKAIGTFLKSVKVKAEQARVQAKEEKKQRGLRSLDALGELAKTKV